MQNFLSLLLNRNSSNISITQSRLPDLIKPRQPSPVYLALFFGLVTFQLHLRDRHFTRRRATPKPASSRQVQCEKCITCIACSRRKTTHRARAWTHRASPHAKRHPKTKRAICVITHSTRHSLEFWRTGQSWTRSSKFLLKIATKDTYLTQLLDLTLPRTTRDERKKKCRTSFCNSNWISRFF